MIRFAFIVFIIVFGMSFVLVSDFISFLEVVGMVFVRLVIWGVEVLVWVILIVWFVNVIEIRWRVILIFFYKKIFMF